MMGPVLFLIFGGWFVGAIALVKASAQQQLRRELVAYRLRFPRNLEAESVAGMLAGLSGLLLPWWKRWLAVPSVAFEVHASSEGIEHYLIVPATWARATENILQASVPSVRYELCDLPSIDVKVVLGA